MIRDRSIAGSIVFGLLMTVIAAIAPQPVHAVAGLLAGIVVPTALLSDGVRRRFGCENAGSVGLAVLLVLAYWILTTMFAVGVGLRDLRAIAVAESALLTVVVGFLTAATTDRTPA